MKIEGKEYRTIWFENNVVKIIDQTKLPHQFIIKDLKTINDAINAIKVMEVRGAPLIGATAAYGLVLAIVENNDQSFLNKSADIFVFLALNLGSAAFLFCLTFLISSAKNPIRGSLASLICNVLTASIKALR